METSGLNAVIRHVRRVVLVSSSDEELLVALANRRDEDAFEVLLKRHGPMVWAVCRRVLRHTQDAEDAFQATFLVLIRKSSSIRKRASIASWLYGVAYRCARKAQAINLRRRRFESLIVQRPQCSVAEEIADLDVAVNALPEKYRLPVVLCELQGRTRKEAADLLKIPEGTLSSRLATARKALARKLGEGGSLLGAGIAAPSKVPAPLFLSTMQTALPLVAGGEAAGVVAGNAILLSQGVLRAMLMMKLKSMVTGVVLLGTMGVGVGHYATSAMAIGPFAAFAKQQASSSQAQQGTELQPVQLDDLFSLLQAADNTQQDKRELDAVAAFDAFFAQFQAVDNQQRQPGPESADAIELQKKKDELEKVLKQKEIVYNSLKMLRLGLSKQAGIPEVPDDAIKQAGAELEAAKQQWAGVSRRLQILLPATPEPTPEQRDVAVKLITNQRADLEAQMKAKELQLRQMEREYRRSKELYDLTNKRLQELGGQQQSSDEELKNKAQKELDRLEAEYKQIVSREHTEAEVKILRDYIAMTRAYWNDLARKTQQSDAPKHGSFSNLAGRFKFRIPVQFYDRVEKKGARIEIHEVWGTRPKIEVGGQYVVHGKYEMPQNTKGKLYFYVTSEGDWPNGGPLDLQTMNAEKGLGEFTLVHSMGGPGKFHVQLLDEVGKDGTLANVYFK